MGQLTETLTACMIWPSRSVGIGRMHLNSLYVPKFLTFPFPYVLNSMPCMNRWLKSAHLG